jgi:biotin carboxylase
MHKVLLVDTNFSSAPIYNYLMDSGFEVFVIGGNPNDFLAKSVKNYIQSDYSNVDKTRAIIEEKEIEYIVPGCNDLSYQVCASLNSRGSYYGLDTLETTELINNKEKFRKSAAQIGLSVPRLISSDNAEELWPVIVKPVDAYSGRGMTIVRKTGKHDLNAAIDHAKEFSRSKTCIIEEYVEGQLYSHSAFLADGNIVADFIVEEHGTANPFVVDTSRVIYDFSLEILTRIRDEIALMSKELCLVDGVVHTQFIKNGNSFWLIEITRRCPGDLYSQLIELSTGFRYAATYAKPFVNQEVPLDRDKLWQSWVLRHTISQAADAVLGSIQFNLPVLIEKLVPLSLVGDRIKPSPFGRVALLFLRTNSQEELLDLFQKTLNRSLYTIHKTH